MKPRRVQAALSVPPSVCLPPSCLISLHHCEHISPGHEAVMHSSLHQGMNFWSWISSSLNIILALNAVSILVVFYTRHMPSMWCGRWLKQIISWWINCMVDLPYRVLVCLHSGSAVIIWNNKHQSEEIPYICSQSFSMTESWDSQELQSDGCCMGCREPLGNP